jgi:hypothetical protein
MPSLQKMQQVVGKPMPHAGQMVRRVMDKQLVNQAELSRRMQVSQTTLTRMLRQPTLHAALLWKLGLVLQHNFFEPLALDFPIAPQPTAAALEQTQQLQQQIAALQQQLAEAQLENRVYQKVLGQVGKLRVES